MITPVMIYYDVNTQSLIESDGGTSPITPSIYLHNAYNFYIQLYNSYSTKYNLSSATTFKVGIGTPGTVNDPLVEVTNANIDSSSKSTGYVIGYANINTSQIITDMGTTQTKLYAAELKADDNTTIAQFAIYVKNTVYKT